MKQKYTIFFTVLISYIIGVSIQLFSQQYAWVQRSNYSGGPRYAAFCFSIGQKGYIGSGVSFLSGNISYTNIDFWEYDPVNDIWTQMANIPGLCRSAASGFSIGNKGYLTLGWTGPNTPLTSTYEYDPILNIWTAKSSFAGSPRYTASSFTIGNFAYVGTGYAPLTNDYWKYDPINDTWTQIADVGGPPRQATSGFALNGYGYVFGGSQQFSYQSNELWRYDTTNNSWLQMANLPSNGRNAAAAISWNGYGFVDTGGDDNGTFADFWRYDPTNNSWLQIASFGGSNRIELMALNINGRAFAGTGSTDIYPNMNLMSDWWELVEVSQAPVANFTCNDSIWCEKNCVDFFDISQNNPTTWQWTFTGASPSSSTDQNPVNICFNTYGAFPVTLISCNGGNCDTVTKTNYIIINQPPAIPTISQSNDTLYSSPSYAYEWFELGNPGVVLSTNSYHVVTQPGSYYVNAIDANGCNTPSAVVVISGVDEFAFNCQFNIFPNPATDVLYLTSKTETEFTYSVFDTHGKCLMKGDNNGKKTEIPLVGFVKGYYFLQIESKSKTLRQKFFRN